MEENLQHLLSNYCKCANCDELMGTVFIMNKRRFCEKCVQTVLPNESEEWLGFEKSGIWTQVCRIYRDYLRNEPIFHSDLGTSSIEEYNKDPSEEELKKIEEYLKLGIKSSKKTLTIAEEIMDIEEYLKADSGQSESDSSSESDSEEMSD